MRKFLITVYICIQSGFLPVLCTGSDTLKIEGLFYEDGLPVSITISGGRIEKITRLPANSNVPRLFIAPGLIDIQINGYMGVDFGGPGLTVDGVRRAVTGLWSNGVTSFLPTVITNSHDNLKRSFTILSESLKEPDISNSVPGFHLEGPYISPEEGYRGAHLEKYIRKPDWAEFSELQQAAGGKILLVTVAPETEGAIDFIRRCTASGVIVALGHHNGTSDVIKEAVDAGASLATHIGNGCANMINRHLNPLWPQLADDRLAVSIIADGYHLTREEVQCFYKIKGTRMTILVSDALDLAGLPPGEYIRGERNILLTPDVAKYPAGNVLAGAVSTLNTDVGNVMKFTGCSLKDAVKMATSVPSGLLNLNHTGELRPGKRADIILFTIDDGKITVQKTIVAGKVVFNRK